MADDQVFRWVLLAGALLVLPVAAYHRVRAHTGEKLDRRQEGLFILVTLRLLGLVGAVALVAFLINPAWMAWSAVPLPAWARWAGVPVGVLGVTLLAWTLHHLGTNLTDTVVTRQRHTLVTTGPYRWVRHPFYVAFALALLANALAAANWFLFAVGAAAIFLLAVRSRTEEAKLLERFGDDYRRYRERTGRFAPRVGVRR